MRRDPLPLTVVARIRRERLAPERTQWDYLHLVELLHGFRRALATVPATEGPALDIFCGTQPYREIIPWRPLWGLDIDLHFGGASVVGSVPLPFRDRSLSVVVCTQALHLTDDPVAVVEEMGRVLEPGGYVVVTIPHLFRRDISTERRLSRPDLEQLFTGWEKTCVTGAGGVGTGWAYFAGKILAGAARRRLLPQGLVRPMALVINAMGKGLDFALRSVEGRWPAILILVARRPVA